MRPHPVPSSQHGRDGRHNRMDAEPQNGHHSQAASHGVKVSPHDPLLDYKRPRLVELLHEARSERDEAKRQLKAERSENEQRTQAACADLEQRYHKLLQEHMSCGITIAKLEAQGASYLTFLERFRSALQREEHS